MMTEDEVLAAFRDTQALLSGHFELRSGLHSDRFFQCAKALQWPAVTARLCGALAEKLDAEGLTADTVISPAMGGLFVGHELARATNARSIFAEKESGKLVLRRGFSVDPGESFIVAEDVVTRGGRVRETIDIVLGLGGVVRVVAALVDRGGGEAKFDAPLVSLLRMTPATWPPDACPLCKTGSKPDRPGS